MSQLLTLLTDLHLLLFVGTFTLTALAIHFRDRKGVRTAFMTVFIILLLLQGTVLPPGWPFNGWTLFGQEAPQNETRYEYRVADAEGNELLYDTRATGVLIGPVMDRYGRKSTVGYWGETFTPAEREQWERYLLSEARAYRDEVESGAYDAEGEFPRHQLDYRWTQDRLEPYGEFVELRLYRVNIQLSETGENVQTNETLMGSYERSVNGTSG
jgi:hypothetical protein